MDDANAATGNGIIGDSSVLDVYPLSCYYFGSMDSVPFKNDCSPDESQVCVNLVFGVNGFLFFLCLYVGFVLCGNLFFFLGFSYDAYGMRNCVAAVIVNSIYKLPGGRLRPGESDIQCLKRKLSSKLSAGEDGRGPEWEECIKLFLVKLPTSRRFIVPKNFRLLAVPLCQLHDNDETYGPIISGVPQLLSKFSFNFVEP
ncbi:UNVERIFIED_CONTAM: Pre-cleavage factor Im subunit [Sesamum calycinum]|uniref:Pre-cleavage factor Im subunit n=1 Tax=Sesamum calycinum TaxID=2727403 RepID=A0AAW2N1B9_9LAMI